MQKTFFFLFLFLLFDKIAFGQERIDSISYNLSGGDTKCDYYLDWAKYRNGKIIETYHECIDVAGASCYWEHRTMDNCINRIVYSFNTRRLEISDKKFSAMDIKDAFDIYIGYQKELHNSLVKEPEAKAPPDKIEIKYNIIKPDTLENLADIKFAKGMQFNKSLKYGLLTDKRDNKIYKTIQIGTQTWMAENLAYKTKDDCWAFKDDESYVPKYGRLYNGNVAQTICPAGWHLPSDEEWKQLESFLGMADKELAYTGLRGEGVGAKLMASVSWRKSTNVTTNSSGFSALSGECFAFGVWPNHPGINAYFWTSTSPEKSKYWYRILLYNSNKICRANNFFSQGFSVRCIKDN